MGSHGIKDQVAIVGLGSTGFSRDAGERSPLSLACEASIKAIEDAGLKPTDLDGVVSTLEPQAPRPNELSSALGIPDVTRRLSTGQEVRVDGDQGIVSLERA